jgi:ring-1,2-phenylacetyl-CoA epoxidase subunit PaaC
MGAESVVSVVSVVEPFAREWLLALADDEICLGHWYASWIGLAPFLEEDLAFTSIGQDELGHARALYELIEPGGDLDRLAYGRSPENYRCSWLAERPCPLWEELFVRHLLYDEAEAVRWEAVAGSSLPGLAGLADRALAEERYHTRHARTMFDRLMGGGAEARERLTAALERLLPLAVGMFEPTEGDGEAVSARVVAAAAVELAAEWRRRLDVVFLDAGHRVAWPALGPDPGGRRGVRSGPFLELYAEMTRVYALDPTARW